MTQTGLRSLWMAALVAAGCSTPRSEEPPKMSAQSDMVRVTGVVRSVESEDVSKRAGVENWRSHLQLQVEATDPAEARGHFGTEQHFIGAGKFGQLKLEAGDRVQVTTNRPAHPGAEPLSIYDLAPAR